MEKKIEGIICGVNKSESSGTVNVCLEGEAEYIKLFDFNPNEVEIKGKELAGLTIREAIELYRRKDAAYQMATK